MRNFKSILFCSMGLCPGLQASSAASIYILDSNPNFSAYFIKISMRHSCKKADIKGGIPSKWFKKLVFFLLT